MWKRLNLFFFTAMIMGLGSSHAFAEATVQVFPNKLMFEGDVESGTLTIMNNGSSSGLYTVEWVDNGMASDGSLFQWQEEGLAPWSIQSHVRYAPRRTLLKPGQRQVIKIALKRNVNVSDGEYFSHIKIRMLDSNVEATTAKQQEEDAEEPREMKIIARQVIAVPVIWRKGDLPPQASLASASLDATGHKIDLVINRSGTTSTRGYVSIYPQGSKEPVSETSHVVIYPTTDHKSVRISLKQGVDIAGLKGRKVRIVYVDETGKEDSALFDALVDL